MERIERTSEEQHPGEWQVYVQKGQALLEKNAVIEAIDELEQAPQEVQDHVMVKTLLALAHLKMGHWAESAELYSDLSAIDEMDTMVRLNAAVSYIQMGSSNLARPFLEEVVSLQPGMLKARSLLGTVYRSMEWYEEAQQQFSEAGQDELAAQMAEMVREREEANAIEEETPLFFQMESKQESVPAEPTPAEPTPAEPVSEELELPPKSISDDFDAALNKLVTSQDELDDLLMNEPLEFQGFDLELEEPAENVGHEAPGTQSVIVVPSLAGSAAPQSRKAFGLSAEEDVLPFTLVPPRTNTTEQAGGNTVNVGGPTPLWVDVPDLFESPEQVFALLEDGRLFMQIQECGYVRLNDLMLLIGEPNVKWESKRFQGKPIEQLFGPRDNPIACIEGTSHLLLGANEEKKRTSVLLAGADVAYFREGAVLAFGTGVQWENGRVPSALDNISDLPLDNFWGEGELIIESSGPIWGVPVKRDRRVRVELQRLVGWVGSLVPQIIADKSLSPSLDTRAFIEFEGEGGILISS